MSDFNMLYIIAPLLFAAALWVKPFRRLISYCAKNIIHVLFFVIINFICSVFGFIIPLNIFSLAVTLLLGLPGISLALFLALIV